MGVFPSEQLEGNSDTVGQDSIQVSITKLQLLKAEQLGEIDVD